MRSASGTYRFQCVNDVRRARSRGVISGCTNADTDGATATTHRSSRSGSGRRADVGSSRWPAVKAGIVRPPAPVSCPTAPVSCPTAPGGRGPDCPGAAPDCPGAAPDCPGAAPDCPGVVPDWPGAVPDCPGVAPNRPGADTVSGATGRVFAWFLPGTVELPGKPGLATGWVPPVPGLAELLPGAAIGAPPRSIGVTRTAHDGFAGRPEGGSSCAAWSDRRRDLTCALRSRSPPADHRAIGRTRPHQRGEPRSSPRGTLAYHRRKATRSGAAPPRAPLIHLQPPLVQRRGARHPS